MVTVLRHTYYGSWVHDVRCLSTDEKPTEGIFNGSSCIEMDTGTGYMFDAENGEWHELPSGGSVVIPTATGVEF